MRKNFGAQPLLYPQLVMVIASYGKDGTPGRMRRSWTKRGGSIPPG